MDPRKKPLIIVVGSGGVGKTTLAAAMGIRSAQRGDDTLVMTFDPSLRLKDALGVGEEAADREVGELAIGQVADADEEGHHRKDRQCEKGPPSIVHRPVCGEHRDQHQHDHPRRTDEGLGEPGEVDG